MLALQKHNPLLLYFFIYSNFWFTRQKGKRRKPPSKHKTHYPTIVRVVCVCFCVSLCVWLWERERRVWWPILTYGSPSLRIQVNKMRKRLVSRPKTASERERERENRRWSVSVIYNHLIWFIRAFGFIFKEMKSNKRETRSPPVGSSCLLH